MSPTQLPPPQWGCNYQVPDNARAAFGARLLDSSGERLAMLYDRKSVTALPDVDRNQLVAQMTPFWERVRPALLSAVDPRFQSYTVYVYAEQCGADWLTLVASQNSSHGYVYMTIWLTPDAWTFPEPHTTLTLKPKPKRRSRT